MNKKSIKTQENCVIYSFKSLAILLGISRDKLKHLLDYFNILPCKESMHAGRIAHYYDEETKKFINEQLKKDINWKDVFTKKFYDEHPEAKEMRIIKQKQTMIERYGVDNPSKVKEFQDKKKETFLLNHNGVSQNEYMRNFFHNLYESGRFKELVIKKNGSLDNYYFLSQIKREQTCISKYGSLDNYYKYIQNKSIETLQKKYGNDITNVAQIPFVKEKIIKKLKNKTDEERTIIKNKIVQTCLDRYGVQSYSQTNEYLEKSKYTYLQKYNSEHFTKSNEYKKNVKSYMKKQYESKKKNNTFHTSSLENKFDLWLQNNNFNFKKQYRDDKYPFTCDFYLLDYDLYIEIQGTWTHGGHPFDINNQDDINKLELWKSKNTKYYDNAIETWTIRDVKKRNIAKENKLNFLEFFNNNVDEVIKIFNEYIKTYVNINNVKNII